MTCACGRATDRPDGECFACHVRGVGFTFRGVHLGQKQWHEDTLHSMQQDIYAGARASGTDITRV